jgi:hypothetical protein
MVVRNMFDDLLKYLEYVSGKSPVIVRISEWKYLNELCELILCMSCSKVYYTLNNIEVLKGSLSQPSKEMIESYSHKNGLTAEYFEEERKVVLFEKLNK